jgi:hypothetical protein
VLALAAALALAYASASPAPAARHTAAPRAASVTPRPASSTEPNPFTLDPNSPATPLPLPVIGTTRTRAVCSALRQAVAPAVAAAMTNDKAYQGFRKWLFDYTVKATETSRDLKLMQMDREVQATVKSTESLENALNSHAFDAPPNATSKDAETMAAMRKTLRGVLEAQKIQLDAMSGFVETERMGRFGRNSEQQDAVKAATGPETGNLRPSSGATPAPSSGFLRDSSLVFKQPPGSITLDNAHNLDKDLANIAAYTAGREDAASKVIIPATNLCK